MLGGVERGGDEATWCGGGAILTLQGGVFLAGSLAWGATGRLQRGVYPQEGGGVQK